MSFKYTPATLKKMEQLYDEMRYIVRYERGNFNSGYCILEDRRIVVVNRFLNAEGRINALIEILPSIAFNETELSVEMMKWYQLLMKPELPEKENSKPPSSQIKMDI